VDFLLPPGQAPLGREKDVLAGADGTPDYRRSRRNRTIWFGETGPSGLSCFEEQLLALVLFHVQTHFGDSTEESTISNMSWMKGENSGNNRSDLDKSNILEATFNTLTEEGRKAFEAYHTNLEELILLRYEVARHGTVLNDTTPIIFHRPEVIPEVRPDPSPSRNDIQSIINSALERQAKSTDDLLHRLIEEWDVKKLDNTSVNRSSSFTQTNPHTSGPSVSGTSKPNPSAQPVNHFHS
jgi:hypothetical protein